jgi:hypothetical protein
LIIHYREVRVRRNNLKEGSSVGVGLGDDWGSVVGICWASIVGIGWGCGVDWGRVDLSGVDGGSSIDGRCLVTILDS